MSDATPDIHRKLFAALAADNARLREELKRSSSYRDEVLREAAEMIRANIKDPNPLASLFTPFAGTLAADLIDPDKETS